MHTHAVVRTTFNRSAHSTVPGKGQRASGIDKAEEGRRQGRGQMGEGRTKRDEGRPNMEEGNGQ